MRASAKTYGSITTLIWYRQTRSGLGAIVFRRGRPSPSEFAIV
jgi:hypothetical protein